MSLSNDLQQINHEISLQEAINMTTRFRTEMQSMLKPEYANTGVLPISETFKKAVFADLALQSGCVGIRAYLGMDEDNKVRLIFVGVDDENTDILDSTELQRGYIFEYGQRCPPICGGAGPLNPQP